MKKYFLFLCLAFVQLLLWSSCGEKECDDPANPKCPNYNPCFDSKPVTARFKILETTSWYRELWEDYETDTILTGEAKFEAEYIGDAEYTWIIGAGRYEGRGLGLSFISSVQRDINIPITLIVKKAPDKVCNPTDDGVDTLTRNMYLASRSKVASSFEPYIFKGSYADNLRDTFTVSIIGSFAGDTLRNIPKGTFSTVEGTTGYRQYVFENLDQETRIGRILLKPNDSINIYFYTQKLGSPKVYKTFLGKKIQ